MSSFSNTFFDFVGTNTVSSFCDLGNVCGDSGSSFRGVVGKCEGSGVKCKGVVGKCEGVGYKCEVFGDSSYFWIPPTPVVVSTGCHCHHQLYDQEEHNSLEETPSFLNQIIAPPSEFADYDQNVGNTSKTERITVGEEDLGGSRLWKYQEDKKTTTERRDLFGPGGAPYFALLEANTTEFYESYDMGWGQPSAGKRCRDQNGTDQHHSGYLASESETDEELRAHLMNKRSRDVSPVRHTQADMDLTAKALCTKSSDQHNNGDNIIEPLDSASSDTSEPSSSVYSEASSCTSVISTTKLILPGRCHKGCGGLASGGPPSCSDETDDDDELFGILPSETTYLAPPSGGFVGRNSIHVTADLHHYVHGPSQQQKQQDKPLMGCPAVPHKRLVPRTKATDAMVVGKIEEGISSSSSSGSSSLNEDKQGSPTRTSKFKGPRVPASRGARLPPIPRRKHVSPGLSKAAKSARGKAVATAIAAAVAAASKSKGSDVEEEEEEFDAEDDGLGLKGDEAVEDDASTSTDITLPNIVRNVVPPIRPSYFPFVPPYINFCMHDEKSEVLPVDIRKHLKWRMSTITPVVIRKTVGNSGFRLLKKTVEWGGQWGKHMKGAMFRQTLKDYQKLNHLPATFQLGRKDRLWKNVYRYILKFGKTQYGFLPRTYILPHDMKQLKYAWDASESRGNMWIVKPPAGARGTGIRVINKWNQVPKKKPVIVQQYIAKPLLINDRKFDLRLYVLVTNFHPLRAYLYNDGLVRFAPVKYSQDSKRVNDRFMHLTNYSINKNCDLYTQNEDANACKGHKWTLKTLWRVLRGQGIDTSTVIKRIEDIIIKTLISAEECITASSFHMPNRYNGYELFGFDVILDENYKPWLLEVNISPSLHSSSSLDLAVKGPLVKEVFNIVGYHLPPLLTKQARKIFVERLDKELELEKPTFDKRIYTNLLSKEDKGKQGMFKARFDDRSQYLKEIIETLTPDDIRHLIIAEDELSQCNGFNRIFPTRQTHSYFAFFEGPRYYNMLMDAWENKYDQDRAAGIVRLQELCRRKIHLSTATSGAQPTSPESQEGRLCDAGGDGGMTRVVVVGGHRMETSDSSSSASETVVADGRLAALGDSVGGVAAAASLETESRIPPASSSPLAKQDPDAGSPSSSNKSPMDALSSKLRPSPLSHYVISDAFGAHHHHLNHHHLPTPSLTCHHHSHPDENRLTSNNNVSNNNGSPTSNTPNVSEYNKIKGVCY